MSTVTFKELPLSNELRRAITDMGFEEPTPIQGLSIPVLLEGQDVIGQAQTGTGKTAAFGIPVLEKVNTKEKKPQALILCPTRELAIQVAEEMKCLGKYKKDLAILPVYGGQPIERQIHSLRKGVQIIIGTPGRVMDHMDRRTLDLSSVSMVVLDESDEMLDMGFREDIELILQSVPPERQTVFFSATMPKPFLALTKKFQKNPRMIKVAHEKLTVPRIEQIYYEARENQKPEVLSRLLDIYTPQLSLVFCNTKRKVDEVVSALQARGYAADAIHGDMNQVQRDRVMAKFRKGTVEILVATDVAARGIDVENVEAVFNYDVPQDEEYYVHRIGRTGRAGKSGRAFTFVAGKDIYKLRDIQRYAKVEIKRKQVPSLKDVEQVRVNQLLGQVRDILDAGDLAKYVTVAESLIDENNTSLDVAAALLKMFIETQEKQQEAEQKEDFGDTGAEPGMVRLFINVGRKRKISPGDIVGAIAGETGIDGKSIGRIDIRDNVSFVEVPEEHAREVMNIMRTRNIKGNRIAMDLATKKY